MKKVILMVMASMMMGAPLALAQNMSGKAMSKNKMEPTTEQREKMAAMHEKMAVCLRSTKPVMDCKKEMMKSCHDSMGKEGCPMMDHMGMGHHKMMDDKDE